MPACGSPLLFAACHVLLRRLVPWHPPCALVRLIFLRMTFVIVDPETNCLIYFSGKLLPIFPHYLLYTVQFSMYNRVPKALCGGDEESRTPDPLLARQMLYQLSYTPIRKLNVQKHTQN